MTPAVDAERPLLPHLPDRRPQPRRLVRTRRARQDLVEIWQYIAADNPTAADALLDRIDESCRRLAEHPQLGPCRHDIRPISGISASVGTSIESLMTASRSSASSMAGVTCSAVLTSRAQIAPLPRREMAASAREPGEGLYEMGGGNARVGVPCDGGDGDP
jgi:plasmid stabilization system protein ParE